MKKGDRVTIYEEPITERIIEGLATLKEKCSTPDLELDDGSHLEHWIVKFDGDDAGQFYRKIKVRGTCQICGHSVNNHGTMGNSKGKCLVPNCSCGE